MRSFTGSALVLRAVTRSFRVLVPKGPQFWLVQPPGVLCVQVPTPSPLYPQRAPEAPAEASWTAWSGLGLCRVLLAVGLGFRAQSGFRLRGRRLGGFPKAPSPPEVFGLAEGVRIQVHESCKESPVSDAS